MAEPSKYVSLRDLLESDPPKHRFTVSESTASDDEDDGDVEDLSLRSFMVKNRNLSSTPPQPKFSDVPEKVPRGDPATCEDKGKHKIAEKDRKGRDTSEASKSGTRSARFSSQRRSRSDDPLVYMGRRDEDDDFDTFEDLKTASRRLVNFSWEEMNLKSNAASDSDNN